MWWARPPRRRPVARLSAASPSTPSYDEAVASGTLVVSALGEHCLCSPAEHHVPGWGRGRLAARGGWRMLGCSPPPARATRLGFARRRAVCVGGECVWSACGDGGVIAHKPAVRCGAPNLRAPITIQVDPKWTRSGPTSWAGRGVRSGSEVDRKWTGLGSFRPTSGPGTLRLTSRPTSVHFSFLPRRAPWPAHAHQPTPTRHGAERDTARASYRMREARRTYGFTREVVWWDRTRQGRA